MGINDLLPSEQNLLNSKYLIPILTEISDKVDFGSINGIDVSKDGGGDTVKVTLADSDKSGVSSGNVSPNILGGGTIWTDKQDETQIRNYGDKNYSHKGSSLNGVYRNYL